MGKTTALLVGASAIGIGTERDLPNWNSTSNAFLETARGFNDLMLPANEVGLLAGKRRDAYGPIREGIYAFSEGRDRTRFSASTMATASASAVWQGIFVSTAEYSFNDYATFSGEMRSGGEFARCLDVAAVRNGHATVFDSYPENVVRKRQKRWARTELTRLRENCAKLHGTAIEPYLTYLITVAGQLPKKVEKYSESFMKTVRAMRLDGALEHAGRNFALVYAGGCMAIEAEILPWSQECLFQAIQTCFRAAVKDIRGHTDSLGHAQKILRSRLASKEIVHAKPGKSLIPEKCAGYYDVEDGMRSYTIHAKEFRRWFPSHAQLIALLRWFHEQGNLIAGKGSLTPSLKNAQWAERAHRWPGSKPVKSIRFRDPFIDDPKRVD